MKKSVWSFLLALVLLLVWVPTTAFAATTEQAFTQLNDNTIGFAFSTELVSIPDMLSAFEKQVSATELKRSVVVYRTTASNKNLYLCFKGETRKSMSGTYTLNQLKSMTDDGKHVWVYGKAINAVAEVDGKKYETFQEAVSVATKALNAFSLAKPVVLLNNVALTESITVPEGKGLKIDFNNKNITGTDVAVLFDNHGTLSLYSESGRGDLDLTRGGEETGENDAVTVYNAKDAKLTVTNVSISAKNTLDYRAIGILNEGTCNISGDRASVSATGSGAKAESCQAFGILTYGGTVNITGGSFSASRGCGYTCAVCSFAEQEDTLKLHISNADCRTSGGGSEEYSVTEAVYDANDRGGILITSGTFSTPPDNAMLSIGKVLTEGTGKSSWTVSDGNPLQVTNSSFSTVKIAKVSGGGVKIDADYVPEGRTVTITTTPSSGNVVDSVTVYRSGRQSTTVKVNTVFENKTYTFEMPYYDVKVAVTYKAEVSFSDVRAGDYFYQAVKWACAQNIASGLDETHFAPYEMTNRAQMVTFLWRAAGSPNAGRRSVDFTDIDENAYYYTAVLWAVGKGYINGTSTTTFSPDEQITRGQAVAILARVNGVTDGDEAQSHGFADVKDTDYYNNAVAWAKSNKIADGTSNNTFSPDEACKRCQVLTFLWRSFQLEGETTK